MLASSSPEISRSADSSHKFCILQIFWHFKINTKDLYVQYISAHKCKFYETNFILFEIFTTFISNYLEYINEN